MPHSTAIQNGCEYLFKANMNERDGKHIHAFDSVARCVDYLLFCLKFVVEENVFTPNVRFELVGFLFPLWLVLKVVPKPLQYVYVWSQIHLHQFIVSNLIICSILLCKLACFCSRESRKKINCLLVSINIYGTLKSEYCLIPPLHYQMLLQFCGVERYCWLSNIFI